MKCWVSLYKYRYGYELYAWKTGEKQLKSIFVILKWPYILFGKSNMSCLKNNEWSFFQCFNCRKLSPFYVTLAVKKCSIEFWFIYQIVMYVVYWLPAVMVFNLTLLSYMHFIIIGYLCILYYYPVIWCQHSPLIQYTLLT